MNQKQPDHFLGNSPGNGIIVTDSEGTILSVNKSFCSLTGYEPMQIIGKSLNVFKPQKKDKLFYIKIWERIQKEGNWHGKIRLNTSDGKENDFRLTLHAARNDQKVLQHCIGIIDIPHTDLPKENNLYTLAYFDTLTGLPNRRLFLDRLSHALSLAQRGKETVGLLYFDLDDFKSINDSFGHDFGDRLLCEIAKRTEHIISETDTLARLGGDEFALLMERLQSADDVSMLARRLIDVISEPIQIGHQTLYTSASVGLSLFPQDGKNARQLLSTADHAMYKAKEHGKNQFTFFETSPEERHLKSSALLNDMPHALEYNEFFIHYQPQFDLISRSFTGAEMLIRWMHPKYGLVSPADFIPLSEMNGLITPITERILVEASENFTSLDRQGFTDFSLSVNLSPRMLSGGDFISDISFFLDNYHLPEHRLNIEITENTFMKNISDLITKLDYLRKRGVKIEIDDYGTGFTSLNYLINLPVHTLKIDRAFVTDIDKSPKDRAILRSMIDMAHHLGLNVVAEGAETKEEAHVLELLQCDKVQGYYYSKPIPFEALTALLHS